MIRAADNIRAGRLFSAKQGRRHDRTQDQRNAENSRSLCRGKAVIWRMSDNPHVQRSLKQTLDAAPVVCVHAARNARARIAGSRDLPWHKRIKPSLQPVSRHPSRRGAGSPPRFCISSDATTWQSAGFETSMRAIVRVALNKPYTFRRVGDADRLVRLRRSCTDHDRHISVSLHPGRRGSLGQQRPAARDVETGHLRPDVERPSQRHRAGQSAAEMVCLWKDGQVTAPKRDRCDAHDG